MCGAGACGALRAARVGAVVAAWVGFAGACAAEETAAGMARQLGREFQTRTSLRFTVVSDSDAATVRGILDLAESTRERVEGFARELQIAPRRPATLMLVVLFDTWKGYEAFARTKGFVVNEAVPGFFDEAGNCCYLFNYANAGLIRRKREELLVARAELIPASNRASGSDAQALEKRDRRLARIREVEAQIDAHLELVNSTVVRHEIAHEVLWNLGMQRGDQLLRRWLKEGLAMQFETVEAANRYRLADWRAIDWERMSLREVVGDSTLIGPGAANPQQAYAAAWGLVRYLIRMKPKELAEYIRSTGSWEKDRADCLRGFEDAFGPIDAGFERRCREIISASASTQPTTRP